MGSNAGSGGLGLGQGAGRPRSVNSSFDHGQPSRASARSHGSIDQAGYLSDRNDLGYHHHGRGMMNGGGGGGNGGGAGFHGHRNR